MLSKAFFTHTLQSWATSALNHGQRHLNHRPNSGDNIVGSPGFSKSQGFPCPPMCFLGYHIRPGLSWALLAMWMFLSFLVSPRLSWFVQCFPGLVWALLNFSNTRCYQKHVLPILYKAGPPARSTMGNAIWGRSCLSAPPCTMPS